MGKKRFNTYKYKNIRIINKTKIPKTSLHKMIDFCRPKEIQKTAFNLLVVYRHNYRKTLRELKIDNRTRRLHYPFVGLEQPLWIKEKKNWVYRPLIVVTVPVGSYEYTGKGSKKHGYLPFKVENNKEDFLRILSHEMFHVVQDKLNIPYKAKSETDADKYSMKVLREYNKMHDERFKYVVKLLELDYGDVYF